ncbi:MAG: hypothetical protein HW421_2922 [Ignavibacteria bacterium]|nr:hypothetical protein [Ignavibacteria bacterium]
MKIIRLYLICAVAVLLLQFRLMSYTPAECQVTLYNHPSSGYLFLGPFVTGALSLSDNTGTPVKLLNVNSLGPDYVNVVMQPNGTVTYFDAINNKHYALNENLAVVDSFSCGNELRTDFHDLKVLPNGYALLLADVDSIIDMRQFIQNGNPRARVKGFIIQQIDRYKNVVFRWNSFEHIPVTDATDDIDLTAPEILYIHCNSVELAPDGNLLLSSRHLDEITKINISSGQIIWRMGGKKCKNNQFTFINDSVNGFFGFSHQHDVQVLPNGHLLLLDNGNLKPTPYTRAVEYEVNEANMTVRKVWEYRNTPDVFDPFMGSVQRLPNGNTVIGWGGASNFGETYNDENFQPVVTEVKSDGTKVFEMQGKGFTSYKVKRHIFRMNSITKTLNFPGVYLFNDGANRTNIELNLTSSQANGDLTIDQHRYVASNISIPIIKVCTYHPYRWVLSYSSSSNVAGKIKFKLADISGIVPSQSLVLCYRSQEGTGQFRVLQSTVNTTSQELEADFAGFGEYIICSTQLEAPAGSFPGSSSYGNEINGKLQWNNVASVEKYSVQLSEKPDFIQKIIDETELTVNNIAYSNLDSGTTYYWRLQSSNANCTSNWSDIKSFVTVLPLPNLLMPSNNTTNSPVEVKLGWNNVKGAESYNVMVANNLNFDSIIYNNTGIYTTDCDVKNLEFNVKYYWKVRGMNGNIPGPWSEVFSFSTKLLAPELRFPINDAVGISATVTLEWKPSFGADVYSAQISDNPNFFNPIDDQSGITSTKITFSNLLNDKKYYWRIKSSNQLAKSDWSEVWKFTTVFGVPILQLPKNTAVGVNKSVYLYWGPVSRATSYNIQISSNVNFTKPIVDRSKIQNNFLSYDSLDYNKTYYWRVSATNSEGTSSWSDFFTFQTVSEEFNTPPILQIPNDYSENIPAIQIFSWVPTKGADKYRIQIALDTNFEKIFKDEIVKSQNNYLAIGFSNFRKYYWHILAMNDFGTSVWSDTWEFETIIGSPDLSFPENNKIDIPISGSLAWLSSSGADSYNVQISKSNTFDINVADFTMISDTTIKYKDLEYSRIYYWRVASNRNSVISNWSNPYTFRTLASSWVEEVGLIKELIIQAYPKPASEAVQFDIKMGNLSPFRLKIFDCTGILLKEFILINPEQNNYKLTWDTPDIASGNYFFVAVCGSDILSGNVIIIK